LLNICVDRAHRMMGKSAVYHEEELPKILRKSIEVSREQVAVSILPQ